MTETMGVLGARGFVGGQVIGQLRQRGDAPVAVSRKEPESEAEDWIRPGHPRDGIRTWISTAPIWVLPEYFDWLAACGIRRIVALSSTSRYTKSHSNNAHDSQVAARLAGGEAALERWAEGLGITCVILRPTLVYGEGLDRNVSDIARVIRRFRFFPVIGSGKGLRQPIHCADVASAAIAATQAAVPSGAFNIVGGETLDYRSMVERIFAAMDRPPLIPSLPKPMVAAAIAVVGLLPRYRHWTVSMAERMDEDMVFDGQPARLALGLSPRGFRPTMADLPADLINRPH